MSDSAGAKRLTNQERAEKIVTQFNGDGACLSSTEETHLQGLIFSQLDEAQREAKSDECHYWANCESSEYFKAGFAAAREKAAQIATEELGVALPNVAERIQKMEA